MQSNADELFNMIHKEKIKVNIDQVVSIDDIQNAQYKMENRLTTGSVVLKF